MCLSSLSFLQTSFHFKTNSTWFPATIPAVSPSGYMEWVKKKGVFHTDNEFKQVSLTQ